MSACAIRAGWHGSKLFAIFKFSAYQSTILHIILFWTPLLTLFLLYRLGQCTYPYFPGFLLTTTPHNILSEPLAASTILETMDSGERGMNHITMTIINPGKEYWPSRRFEPATSCSQVFNATDWGTRASTSTILHHDSVACRTKWILWIHNYGMLCWVWSTSGMQ